MPLWCDPRNGSRARFLQALDDLAEKTGHEELKSVPWCLWGHSGGGTWTSLMMLSDPDRVVAAWLRSGTNFPFRKKDSDQNTEIPESVYQIPAMCNPGQKEQNSRFQGAWDGTLSMFKAYRAHGAPIGFAPILAPVTNAETAGIWPSRSSTPASPSAAREGLHHKHASLGGFVPRPGSPLCWVERTRLRIRGRPPEGRLAT